jgi:hypothetical protein
MQSRLSVYDQLQFIRLYDRHVFRLSAFENTADVNAGLPICIRNVASVRDQPAHLGILAARIDRWYRVPHGEKRQLKTSAIEEGVGGNK